MSRLAWWRLGLVALAALAALLPAPPELVDRFYSTAAYATLQRAMTALSNRAPFALLDVLLVIVILAWLALAVRDLMRRPVSALRTAARIVVRTLVWSAGFYIIFLLAWGLNYRRTPLIQKLPFDARAVTADAAQSLAFTAVQQLNALHDAAHAAGWPPAGTIDSGLAASVARADRQTGGRGVVTAGRPKRTMLDWYFRRAAVDGMTDPYFLETLVSSTLLPFERPFIVAHEWSHLAGVADEGDANFLAWLACVQSSTPDQYSGWLFMYAELVATLRGQAQSDVVVRLGAGPRADLAAIRGRLARHVDRRMFAVGQRVYDQYLKANRVEAGVESYAHVVRLVLGVPFGPGWTIGR
jgi:uncharacterized protein DUF3810